MNDPATGGATPFASERERAVLSAPRSTLSAFAFEPHRHDTYAIGITTAGVQTFRYRGTRRFSLPGQLVILHPDETHDEAAGTDEGFGYRSIYVAPELIRDALGGSPKSPEDWSMTISAPRPFTGRQPQAVGSIRGDC